MNKIPRTFCVTLKETPARTKGFIENAEKAGISYEFFHGVLGTRMGLNATHPNDIECPDKDIYMTQGAVGCVLSHFTLWNALLYCPEEEFFILEDDAVFEENFKEKFEECYSRLPSNWDMVYVGWLPNDNSPPPLIVDKGLSLRVPSGTQAYIIKKSILKQAIEKIQPCRASIDLLLAENLLPFIKYYVFDPSLVSQRSYLNVTDPIWNSLVYDWKNDLYGCKKTLFRGLALTDGWHRSEKDDNNIWRWSKSEFKIKIPKNVDAMTIAATSPVENKVTFHVGANVYEKPVKVGMNEFVVSTAGETRVSAKMEKPFIPAENDTNSKDERHLGVCLNRLTLTIGLTVLSIGVADLDAEVTSKLFNL